MVERLQRGDNLIISLRFVLMQNGEKKRKKTVLWALHRKCVSCNVGICMLPVHLPCTVL